MMTKVLKVQRQDAESLLGHFIDTETYDTVIDSDADVYVVTSLNPNETSERNVVLMFRKNYFTKEEQEGAYDGLRGAAKSSQNRGLAAGTRGAKLQGRDWVANHQLVILDQLRTLPESDALRVTRQDVADWTRMADAMPSTRGLVWLTSEREKHNFTFDIWLETIYDKSNAEIRKETKWICDTLVSDTSYANPVDSGVAGWFGRYPRIPFGRATSYTRDNREDFELAYPYLRKLSKAFQDFMPERFKAQMDCAEKLDPGFYVPGTPFTTITVNHNFRTAAHRDEGDLPEGFSNLSVVARDKTYSGGLLILPEIRAAVNLRPGDLLLVANHDYIHGNTPIVAADGSDSVERISLVCYFREDMVRGGQKLGSVKYEQARYDFVEQTRKNSEHPSWFPRFNGVFAGMWDSKEWYDFLRNRDPELLTKYHGDVDSAGSLEDLFS